MESTRTLEEKKIARKFYVLGIVLYLLTTLSILIAKLVYRDLFSWWWVLLPSGLVIGLVFLLLFREIRRERT